MQGISPPPNASPAELQAWQNMMDSMVTFIKAATNLMTAVTSRVDVSVKPSSRMVAGKRSNLQTIPGRKAISDCTGCKPKVVTPPSVIVTQPSAGVPCLACGKTKIPVKQPSVRKPASELATPSGGSKVQAAAEETTANETAAEEPNAAEETPLDEAIIEDTTTEEAPAVEEPQVEASEEPNEEGFLMVGADGSKVKADGSKVEADAPKVQKSESKATETTEKKDETCSVSCTELKPKKKSCLCKEPPPPPPPEEEEEDDCDCKEDDTSPPSCACPPCDEEREQMVKDLKDKLETAQVEIEEMQKDLDKLQRMDASKKVGSHAGPNPAALYKEIMKDSVHNEVEILSPIAASTPQCPCGPDITQEPSCPCPPETPTSPSFGYNENTTCPCGPQAPKSLSFGYTQPSQSGRPSCPCGVQPSAAPDLTYNIPQSPPKRICGPPAVINSLRMQQMSQNMGPSMAGPMPGCQANNRMVPSGYGRFGNTPTQYQMRDQTYALYGSQNTQSPYMNSPGNSCGPNTCLSGNSPGRSNNQMQQSQNMEFSGSFLQNANIAVCQTRYRGGRQ